MKKKRFTEEQIAYALARWSTGQTSARTRAVPQISAIALSLTAVAQGVAAHRGSAQRVHEAPTRACACRTHGPPIPSSTRRVRVDTRVSHGVDRLWFHLSKAVVTDQASLPARRHIWMLGVDEFRPPGLAQAEHGPRPGP